MSTMNSTNEGERIGWRRSTSAKITFTAFVTIALAAAPQFATADATTRAQAKRMYDRLTGTPPSPATLDALEQKIDTGTNLTDTALFIVDNNADAASANFYSVTLKNFATPWTNRDHDVFAPLNDYTATVIGMVRDGKDFRGVLSDDIVYIGDGIGPGYSTTDNNHYENLESTNQDLRAVLREHPQSSVNGLPSAATAGIITSRAAAQAFFIAGTNRAMFRFTMLNHLCRDMEQVHDTTRPPDRIRQDVSRSPGGDSSVFLNNCIGCHSGMDPMAQAFAYYNFDETTGKLVYTAGLVQKKYGINSDNFKPGYVTTDDHWENRWRLPGQNQSLGWENDDDQIRSGNGAKTLGQELAHSRAFAQCQVEKVFRAVCFRSPNDADQNQVKTITDQFVGADSGNLKRVFAKTAAYCAGT
jgi:hypothetical protein